MGMPTRIKFCGMTRTEDVQCALELGVHALGFVFVKESPRSLAPEQAARLIRLLPPFVMSVGLFMDAGAGDIEEALHCTGLNLLQFHGREDEEFCRQFGVPYLKAVPMGSTDSITDFCNGFASASGFVLDSHSSGEMGGTGETFAWHRIPGSLKHQVVLAGGLTPENVAQAIREVQPHAVDVSSGIESAPGEKDAGKMKQFVAEARHGQ
ncbi:MAG: phosphoribosylanthranilate isomerase [Proteobacteria bacterium]|nr:phosphoribosylanthranilate isomerase [Pseudomonadota bacterium]